MNQSEAKKYQLFPRGTTSVNPSNTMMYGQEVSHISQIINTDKAERVLGLSGVRPRPQASGLIRRRKVSIPELGPMTTVHEAAMDSPTIPGRPALHERSNSAPGHPETQRRGVDAVRTPGTGLRFEEMREPVQPRQITMINTQHQVAAPMSPKSLRPLIIPVHGSSLPRLAKESSPDKTTPSDLPSATILEQGWAERPFTPSSLSSTSTIALSATTAPTPSSASLDMLTPPQPWVDGFATVQQRPSTPRSQTEPQFTTKSSGHRRDVSESGSVSSIMERGRPRKRGEVVGAKRGESLADKSNEREEKRKDADMLPKGWRAAYAAKTLHPSESMAIQIKAFQQASKFEILRKDDVERLTKELRHLDERTDYLRKTYLSLRSGRRELQTRICQYLRSPRTAKFSHESMLRQEETLVDLDASIDDWVDKLETAESRRSKIQQKLLEHVAAAATLPAYLPQLTTQSSQPHIAMSFSPKIPSAPVMMAPREPNTPPRSPTKSTSSFGSSSPSPHRMLASHHVPSTIIEQPADEALVTEQSTPTPAAAVSSPMPAVAEAAEISEFAKRRAEIQSMQSIRIYAGDDVYALMEDVENHISEMGNAPPPLPPPKDAIPAVPAVPRLPATVYVDEKRVALQKSKTEDVLGKSVGGGLGMGKVLTPPISRSNTPNGGAPATVTGGGEVYLTSAVFRP